MNHLSVAEISRVFSLPEKSRGVYRVFGIVLPDYDGDDSRRLPLPERLAVDRQGIIRRVDVDPGDTRRPIPEAGLETTRELGSPEVSVTRSSSKP